MCRGVAATLRALPALRALHLIADRIDAACIDACVGLRHLSRLILGPYCCLLPDLAPLVACASLQMLVLVDDSQRNEPLLLPPPASFRGGRGLLALYDFTMSGIQARRQ